MNIALHVEEAALRDPDKAAIVFEDQTVSYRQLDDMASSFAGALRLLSVDSGSRVALFLPNIPAFPVCYLGILKIGAIAVSVNPSLKGGEVRSILSDSGAVVVVTTEELRSPEHLPLFELPNIKHVVIAEGDAHADLSLEDLIEKTKPECGIAQVDPGTPAAILYTSGTTGFPKGATLSHDNVVFTMSSKVRYLGIQPSDRLLLFLPMFHCFGQNVIMNAAFQAGATLVLHRTFDPDRVLASIRADRVTMFFGVPTSFIVLHDRVQPEELSSIRYYFSAAAPLPPEVENKWRTKFGAVIYQGYGLTETSPFASYNHLTQHKAGSVGTSIDDVEMAVVDVNNGGFLPPSSKGEIVIRGRNVMLGYWNRPAENEEAIRDGWFHTGDIGRMDDEGYFYVEDRLKDMVIVGGFNVYPAEIENVFYQHPSVAEVAVYGLPNAVMGERVYAAVVLKSGTTATVEELIAFCRERIADYKVPSEMAFVSELPKSRTGKVLKRVLRDGHAASEQAQTVAPLPTANQLQQEVAAWLSANLAIDMRSIEFDRPFADFGLTSIMAVALAEQLMAWTHRPVVPTITWQFSTIHSLVHHLVSETNTAQLSEIDVAQLSEDEAEAMLVREVEKLDR